MSEEIGEHSNDLIRQAKKAGETIHNKKLNPQKSSFKQRALGWGAGLGLLGASVFAGKEVVDANSSPEWFEKPISGGVIQVDLRKVDDNHEKPTGPTFRDDAKDTGDNELSIEELAERGININSNNIAIREVKGATYSSGIARGFIEGEDGNYGVWGEVMMPDAETEEMKGTGVYLAENFYQKPEPPQSE